MPEINEYAINLKNKFRNLEIKLEQKISQKEFEKEFKKTSKNIQKSLKKINKINPDKYTVYDNIDEIFKKSLNIIERNIVEE